MDLGFDNSVTVSKNYHAVNFIASQFSILGRGVHLAVSTMEYFFCYSLIFLAELVDTEVGAFYYNIHVSPLQQITRTHYNTPK